MPATRPAVLRSVAWLKSASAVRSCACADSARAAERQRLQIGVGRHQHDQIAGALVGIFRGGLVVPLGLAIVDRLEVEDSTGSSTTRASKTLNGPTIEGMPGGSGKPERRQVDHLTALGDPAVDVRQQLAQRLPSRAVGALGRRARPCSNPRLCSSARPMASPTDKLMASDVRVPVGTLPRNGLRAERLRLNVPLPGFAGPGPPAGGLPCRKRRSRPSAGGVATFTDSAFLA